MANEKKNDKKNDATPPALDAASTPPTVPKTALIVAPKNALVIPTVEEVERLGQEAKDKLAAVANLLDDPTLSEASKAQVRALMALANPVKEGMDEVNLSWTVPRIQIAQPTTQSTAKPESTKPGGLFTTSGATLETPFPFMPIYFNYENIMFTEGQKAPECYSPDAKLGSPYGVCKTCKFLPFGQQNEGRGDQQKTDCQNQIVVAIMAMDLSQVYLVQFSKTSRGAGSALMSLAKAQAFPWKQSYLLSTEKKTEAKGTYYVYKIEPTGKNTSDDAVKIGRVFSQLYQANRKRFIGDFYLRGAASAAVAVAGEQAFNGSALDAGLDVEPDLNTPPPPVSSSTVRSSAKPM